MKLTETVKKYLEENIDLINDMSRESALKFLDDFDPVHSEDLACILNVLCDVLKVLPDIKDAIEDYVDEVEQAYNSVSSINILNIRPKVYNLPQEYTWVHKTSYFYLTDPVGSKPAGYESFRIDAPGITHSVLWRRKGQLFLIDSENNQCSAIANLSISCKSFKPSEFYKKEHLTKFITDYKKYIKDIYDSLPLLEASVRWKSDARKIAENVATSIEEIIANSPAYCDVTTKDHTSVILNKFNYFEVAVVPYVKTKTNLNVRIPYDSDPKNIDVDSLMTTWKKNFEKYVKLNKHKF